MNLTIKRADLLPALDAMMGAVSTHSTIPILQNVLISTNGNGLIVKASDMVTTAVTHVPANVGSPGGITLPAKRLHAYVSALSGDEIKLKASESHYCTLNCGQSHTRIPGISPESFPEFPQFGATELSIDAATLAKMIRSVGHAVAQEFDTKLDFEGAVALRAEGDFLHVAAAWPHGVAIATTPLAQPLSKPIRACVDSDSLRLVAKIAARTEGLAELCFSNTLITRIGSYDIGCRTLAKKPPDFLKMEEKLIGKEQATVSCADLSAAIGRAALSLDSANTKAKDASTRVIIDLAGSTLSVWANGNGEGIERIPALLSEPIRFGMNWRYLSNCLKVIDTDSMLIRYNDAKAAITFEPVEGEAKVRFREYIMPVALFENEEKADLG